MKALKIGFLPLCDAATLIAAADLGFAEAEGLRLELERDVSWANLRDKLMIGRFDSAHFLAPLAIATSLGLGHQRFATRAPFLLNLNGNAITIAARLADELAAQDPDALADWRRTAASLAGAVRRRRDRGAARLTFGTVFAFSMHSYLLRRFLAAGGIDPDLDVEIVVVPPPYAVDFVERGFIDGFCVGSPWNSMAAESGCGTIAALGCEIIAAPEKVLALAADSPLLENATGEALMRALSAAAAFAGEPRNYECLAAAMAKADRLDCPAPIIAHTLEGRILLDRKGRERTDANFLRLSGAGINRPDSAIADLIFDEMVASAQITDRPEYRAAARNVFSSAIYDRSAGTGKR